MKKPQKTNMTPTPESMEEFDRLIAPYRDVLDEDSVRTLRARVESVVFLARNSALDEAIEILPEYLEEKVIARPQFRVEGSEWNACIDTAVAKLKELKK